MTDKEVPSDKRQRNLAPKLCPKSPLRRMLASCEYRNSIAFRDIDSTRARSDHYCTEHSKTDDECTCARVISGVRLNFAPVALLKRQTILLLETCLLSSQHVCEWTAAGFTVSLILLKSRNMFKPSKLARNLRQ